MKIDGSIISSIIRENTYNTTAAKATEKAPDKATGKAAQKKAPDTPDTPETAVFSDDIVEISNKAKQSSDEMQAKLEEMRNRCRQLREDLKRAGEAGEGMAEAMKEKIKCLIIAMRIMSGDNVPDEDHRFLADRDPELYHQAVSLRIEKEDPEDYDRLSEDEEDSAINSDEDSDAGITTSNATGYTAESAPVADNGLSVADVS